MKIAYIIIRILLSLQLLLSIVFFVLIAAGQVTMPAPTGTMAIFFTGIGASIYMMPLIKLVELICVISFLTNRYVALAAIMLFPISLNIFFLHILVEPIEKSSIGIGVFILISNLFIAYVNREQYKSLFVAKP